MPRLSEDAPDLAISPDGTWFARLDPGRLRLFNLPDLPGTEPLGAPIAELRRQGGPGQIGFLTNDRLLHVFAYDQGPVGEDEVQGGQQEEHRSGLQVALLLVPSLQEAGAGVTVPGTRRILGIGPAGAVVAPMAAGAEVIIWRRAQLSVDWAFLRGDVLSAVPAPDGRWLIEQRSGYELWDPGTRRVLARLTLATRQPPAQLGFIAGGRLIWALSGGVPIHLELFRSSDGRQLCEIEQPGRALRAEGGLGRLVIAADEGIDGPVFLDVDVNAMEVRRIKPPAGMKPLSFVVRPVAAAAEVLLAALGTGDEAQIVRLPLAPLPGLKDVVPVPEPASQQPQRRPAHPTVPSSVGRLRREPPRTPAESPQEPEPAGPEEMKPTESTSPMMEDQEEHQAPPAPGPPVKRETPPSALSSLRDRIQPLRSPLPPRRPPAGGPPRPAVRPPVATEVPPAQGPERLRRPMSLVGRPAGPTPGSWQGEVLHWAQELLSDSATTRKTACPAGEMLSVVAARVPLSQAGQQVLALLYAAQQLIGDHPRGLRVGVLVRVLGEEVLAEVLPGGALRRRDLVHEPVQGRIRLHREAIEVLAGAPCSGLHEDEGTTESGAGTGEPLLPGLHFTPFYVAQGVHALRERTGQPVLHLDDPLRRVDPLAALRRGIRQALLRGAVLFVDGLFEVSLPAWLSPKGGAGRLRELLAAPAVPVVVCATEAALSALGLSGRPMARLDDGGPR